MSIHLRKQIDRLKKMILSLGTLVEENVELAIRAVNDRDAESARLVAEHDREIDEIELEIEEECLHTLALNQPVAFDLRYVVAVLKMNNDLERIGDLAVNIADQANFLLMQPALPDYPFDLQSMTSHVRSMLKRSLDALVNVDSQLAESVRSTDDEVDAIHKQMYLNIEKAMAENPHQINQLLHMMIISKNLERIADHAVNIADDVLYMAKGELQRHRHEQGF